MNCSTVFAVVAALGVATPAPAQTAHFGLRHTTTGKAKLTPTPSGLRVSGLGTLQDAVTVDVRGLESARVQMQTDLTIMKTGSAQEVALDGYIDNVRRQLGSRTIERTTSTEALVTFVFPDELRHVDFVYMLAGKAVWTTRVKNPREDLRFNYSFGVVLPHNPKMLTTFTFRNIDQRDPRDPYDIRQIDSLHPWELANGPGKGVRFDCLVVRRTYKASVGTVEEKSLTLRTQNLPGFLVRDFAWVRGYGEPCKGSNGKQARFKAEGVMEVGGRFDARLSYGPANSIALHWLGVSNSTWGGKKGFSLPLPLGGLGAPGCRVLASLDVAIPVRIDAQGSASSSITVPRLRVGASIYHQAMLLDRRANALGLTTSAGLQTRIGMAHR